MSARPHELTPELTTLVNELGLEPARARLSRGRSPGSAFLCLPSPDRPQLLVPVHPVSATMISERRSRKRLSRWTKSATSTLLRTGLLDRLPVRRLSIDDPALDELLVWAGGRSDLLVGVLSGPQRANRKPVLRLVTALGATVGYVKVGSHPHTQVLVRRERDALQALAEAELASLRVPEVTRSGRWHDLELLVTSPLATGSTARQPSSLPVAQTRALFAHGARTDLPLRATAPFHEPAGPATELEEHGRELMERAGDRRLPTGAAHGDWTPWNMALGADGVLDVWDWERYAQDVPAGLDVVHFEASRVTADDDFAGTDAFLASLPDRWEECAVDRGVRPLLLPTYLLAIGRRYAADLTQHHAPRAARRLQWVTRLLAREMDRMQQGVTS